MWRVRSYTFQHDLEVVEIDGLQCNVVKTGVATELSILVTSPPGQRDKNDRVSPWPPAYLRGDVEAAHARHGYIDERHIRALLFGQLHALITSRRAIRIMTEVFQDAQKAVDKVDVVVDNHNSQRHEREFRLPEEMLSDRKL